MFWRGFRGEPKISFCLWFLPPRILLVASINHIYGNVVHEYKTLSRWLIAPYLWDFGAHLQHQHKTISLSFGLENIKAMDYYRFKRGDCLTIPEKEKKPFQFFVPKHSTVLLVSPVHAILIIDAQRECTYNMLKDYHGHVHVWFGFWDYLNFFRPFS